jgi:heme/copper-type cytochrome/quinol oxidase subunit 4
MKLSAQMTMVVGAIFAVICFSVAVNGFMSMGDITDAKTAADARGFAWFWAFLGAIAATLAVVSWWMAKNENGDRG